MPRALSSILAGARRPQPRSLYFMDSLSKYYVEYPVMHTQCPVGEGVKELETVTGVQPGEYTLC